MQTDFQIRPRDGAIVFGDGGPTLARGAPVGTAMEDLSGLVACHEDYKNGWQTVRLRGVMCGAWPCEFALRFENGRLDRADWIVDRTVQVYGSTDPADWDSENRARMKVLLDPLRSQLSRPFAGSDRSIEHFPWGHVFGGLDEREGEVVVRLGYAKRPAADK